MEDGGTIFTYTIQSIVIAKWDTAQNNTQDTHTKTLRHTKTHNTHTHTHTHTYIHTHTHIYTYI